MGRDVIIPLDFSSAAEVYRFLDLFPDGERPYVKIGYELFYSEGLDIVKEIKARGFKLFLDLKLHDIPNTVGKGMAALAKLGADITNLHAGGGSAMMQAAAKALEGTQTKLIAVTILTSIGEEQLHSETLIDKPLAETAVAYAKLAKENGCQGVVCSPLEVPVIKAACGADFLTVTPGVRFADSAVGDQARVVTPAKAKELGSDYIVCGRPITGAADPLAAYRRAVAEFV
ncbi:MAG: orotidine-5'-phosphate decarboxylase [Oscillospiraceae bacterium]|jgi:orotidine-5'-phosphate decarboxylase|nr:orotidine-5'-phosphate decarboxylase [Oscillospiraceae bacterium]